MGAPTAAETAIVKGRWPPPRPSRPPVPAGSLLAGVVPAPTGWLVMVGAQGSCGLEVLGPVLEATLGPVVEAGSEFRAVGLAVPVGLPDCEVPGGRTCDRQARRLLGRRRGSAIAPAPSRAALGATTVEQARARGRLSAATWHLLRWIREADRYVDASCQETVVSVHPELSFLRLGGGRPLACPKHTAEGWRERRRRLEAAVSRGLELVESAPAANARWRLADAVACLCTASALAQGAEEHLPALPERDSRGLRMELVW